MVISNENYICELCNNSYTNYNIAEDCEKRCRKLKSKKPISKQEIKLALNNYQLYWIPSNINKKDIKEISEIHLPDGSIELNEFLEDYENERFERFLILL